MNTFPSQVTAARTAAQYTRGSPVKSSSPGMSHTLQLPQSSTDKPSSKLKALSRPEYPQALLGYTPKQSVGERTGLGKRRNCL